MWKLKVKVHWRRAHLGWSPPARIIVMTFSETFSSLCSFFFVIFITEWNGEEVTRSPPVTRIASTQTVSPAIKEFNFIPLSPQIYVLIKNLVYFEKTIFFTQITIFAEKSTFNQFPVKFKIECLLKITCKSILGIGNTTVWFFSVEMLFKTFNKM